MQLARVATCKHCKQPMAPGNGCTYPDYDGTPRIPYGKEGAFKANGPCHDCQVMPGQLHHPGCDVEECPNCETQVLQCGCSMEDTDEITTEETLIPCPRCEKADRLINPAVLQICAPCSQELKGLEKNAHGELATLLDSWAKQNLSIDWAIHILLTTVAHVSAHHCTPKYTKREFLKMAGEAWKTQETTEKAAEKRRAKEEKAS